MLSKRLAIGVPVSLLAVLAFCGPGIAGAFLFLAFALIFVTVGTLEFFFLTGRMGVDGYPKMTAAFAVVMVLTVAASSGSGFYCLLVGHQLEGALMVIFITLGFLRVFRSGSQRRHTLDLLISVGGLVYVCWTLNAIVKLYFSAGLGTGGRFLAFFLIAVIKMGDIGAFAVGTFTAKRPGGNHKMAPKLSPKKSWEGFCGGILASVLTALLLVGIWGSEFVFSDLRVQILGLRSALVFGVILAVLGCAGDLAESALKRAAGTKDSGRVPRFGGVLDMLDSLILAAPLFYTYVYIYSIH